MKKFLVLAAAALIAGCTATKEVVDIYKGDPGLNGTSCSVAPELSGEEQQLIIGARISCTDGSFSVVYNGTDGAQGIQGIQGLQGIQGPQGEAGGSCSAYRTSHSHGVYLSCPDQHPVLISDGKDGDDGRDGASCSTVRQDSQNRVRITCGNTVSYVYDGEKGDKGDKGNTGATGAAGTSCTVTAIAGGAKVQCGSSIAYLANGAQGSQGIPGTPGAQGPQGLAGQPGATGQPGEDAVKPGLSCNVHNLANWDGITNIFTALSNNPAVGNFTLANLNVGDSQAALGFPGMPSSIQDQVGVEGYALDCSGYLNVPTSGVYNFSMLSDDGVRLAVNDQVLINDPGLHAPTTDAANNVTLNRGFNRINVVYYQGPLTQIALQLKWSGPNTALQVVPASAYTH